MFDFHKSKVSGIDIPELLNNSLLNFSLPVNLPTGAVTKNEQNGKYNGIDISVVNDKHINLKGSFHKYHNNGEHNHNDFTIKNLLYVLSDLTAKFNLNPFLCCLENIEFGVNIALPFDTQEFLNAVLSYKGYEYELRKFGGKGYLLRFKLQQYELKIYNKGLQYGLGKNILRVEIKVTRMEYLKSKGIKIHSIADLLNLTEIQKLVPLLLSAFDDLIIYGDSIEIDKLNKRERDIVLNGKNPKYWTEIKERSKYKFRYYRNRFRKLVLKYGKKNIQQTVYELIKNKAKELIKIDSENETNLNSYLNQFTKTCHFLTDLPKTNLPLSNRPIQVEINNLKKSILPLSTTSNSMLERDRSNLQEIIELEYYFKGITLPVQTIRLNDCTLITDVPKFISSHLAISKRHIGNKTFLPYFERLQELKQQFVKQA